jgi:SHS2 domain-containing protein
MPFSELPHTGDLAYRITGDTREEVFTEAIRALFSTITDLGKIQQREERRINVKGQSPEELLVEMLRACFDIFATEEFVATSSTVQLTEGKLTATLRGERFDPRRHPFKTEIKAVTYHGAEAKETEQGWEATFTLDL